MTQDVPSPWGIDTGYHDMRREWHVAPESTVEAVGRSMGMTPAGPPASPVMFARPGQSQSVDGPAEVHTEDGGVVRVDDHLPSDLPCGYHDLIDPRSDSVKRLVVAPRRCWLPRDLHVWGWAVQVYATRSHASWGMGDLGDLHRLGEWAARSGAGMVLINPLHAADPEPGRSSPYFPSSRLFRNPLYLRIEDIPGAGAASDEVEDVARVGRAMNGDRRIDRWRVHELKSAALAVLWKHFTGDADFNRYVSEMGPLLHSYATYAALIEQHGSDWRRWPAELRHPRSPAVARAGRDLGERVLFHKWVQWCLDRQMKRAGEALPIVNDLAIGVESVGMDAWLWQDVFAPDITIGAPPDDFNLDGQGWGVLAFDPWKLQAAFYEPFVHTVRASLRHAGGLRYDHVMGLFRLFWIPRGRSPRDGTYVRYPASDLLDILALESHRAGAYVVGEDLGTVEDGVREELASRDMLSYRLMVFEDDAPRDYPRKSLAGVTNHDLPTIAGLWSGRDLVDQAAAGVRPHTTFNSAARARLQRAAGIASSAPAEDAVAAAYRALAHASSAVVAATLEDALCVLERPNIPGSGARRANWSLALPYAIEAIEFAAGPRQLARLLARRSSRRP